jgi:hypothetical protein
MKPTAAHAQNLANKAESMYAKNKRAEAFATAGQHAIQPQTMNQPTPAHRFTVWIGGVEATAHYLTREQAEAIAAEARSAGFDDTQIEEITQ